MHGMNQTDVILLNFQEVRRRSLILWASLTPEIYNWRPDIHAMSCIEMVRHVLESEHLFHIIVNRRGDLGGYVSPWTEEPYVDVNKEVKFAEPFRKAFLNTVSSFSDHDLQIIMIDRKEKNQKRILSDYLMRIAYHEAVHAGQLLSYLRTLNCERPIIWD
jgi:uncharacterized damage-inducible protein DinB